MKMGRGLNEGLSPDREHLTPQNGEVLCPGIIRLNAGSETELLEKTSCLWALAILRNYTS